MYSTEELLDQLRTVAKLVGHTPTFKDYCNIIEDSSKRASGVTYIRRFGSWNKAVMAAGIRLRKPSHQYSYSRGELIQQLQKLSRVYGHTPSISEVNYAAFETGQYAVASTFRSHFGSYYNAVLAAGLQPRY